MSSGISPNKKWRGVARTLIIYFYKYGGRKNMTFYVTNNLHEQFFVCDNFYLSQKS
jgi:hypothetical protein